MTIDKKMIAKVTLLSLVFAGALGVSSTSVLAGAKPSKQKLTSSRKARAVTLESARKTALRHSSGTVQREEMENQKGRSVYAFDIRSAKGNTNEVWIDARTGRVIRKSRKAGASDAQDKVAYTKKRTKH